MDAPRRRVVVTGAAGRIARAVTPLLPATWDVHGTDLAAAAEAATGPVAALDVTDADACRAAVAGADAVVHLAAVPDPAASWEQLLAANVVGAHHVAHAAAEAGVRRLVLASSLHAVSGMPPGTQSRAQDPPRPGNLYGATKAWAEALGAWVAATTPTTVVAVRIGYFAEQRPGAGQATHQERSAWLSVRDAAELVRAAVEADLAGVAGVDGVAGFVVACGTSANRHRTADLLSTQRALGYRPLDDAWAGTDPTTDAAG